MGRSARPTRSVEQPWRLGLVASVQRQPAPNHRKQNEFDGRQQVKNKPKLLCDCHIRKNAALATFLHTFVWKPSTSPKRPGETPLKRGGNQRKQRLQRNPFCHACLPVTPFLPREKSPSNLDVDLRR